MTVKSIMGVDVGGTFTDLFLWQEGRLSIHKRPSTPEDPSKGVLLGLAESGSSPKSVVHGSTIATNSLLERTGARTALITTRGFRDVLVIGRQTRPSLYDLSPSRSSPLVPDELRLEVDERVDRTGKALVDLDEEQIEETLDLLATMDVESLAVSFLFSFLNPRHERAVAKAARRRGLPVSVSHEILPEHREYERTATTVVNAYVSPIMAPYLTRLERGMASCSVQRLSVMRSDGGSMSPQTAGRQAVRTVLSGPAAGVVGAQWLAKRAGFKRVITLDMGGTSTDVALCDGRVPERDEVHVEDIPLRGASVDVVSVGAGGGCMARLDEAGALRVGPDSAGADPGPACYGKASEPTVTDANMAMGRLIPKYFLGGRLPIDPARSLRAMDSLAPPFDGNILRAAAAVVRVANANIERAVRIVSVERGHDPRRFVLLAFGGAGPLHACDIASVLRIPKVVVPPYPGVLSAFGMVIAQPTRDLLAPAMVTVPPSKERSWQQITILLEKMFGRLIEQGRSELTDEGFPTKAMRQQRFLELRYLGQSYEISVPVDDLSPSVFLPRFHKAHLARYSHSDRSRPVEVVNLRLKLTIPSRSPSLPTLAPTTDGNANAIAGSSVAWFDRRRRTPVYDRSLLGAGHMLKGPAIVVQMDATTVIPPRWRGSVDKLGNLILEEAHA